MTDEPDPVDTDDEDDAEEGDDSCVYDGEAFLLAGARETCNTFGLIGLLVRDGFLYGYKLGEGEVLFHDVLKKHKTPSSLSRVK